MWRKDVAPRGFWRELDLDRVGPRQPLVELGQRRRVTDLQGEVVQAHVALAIEGSRRLGVGGLHRVSMTVPSETNAAGYCGRSATSENPSTSRKKPQRGLQPGHGQAHVVHPRVSEVVSLRVIEIQHDCA